MCARRWHLQLFGDDAAKLLLLYIFSFFPLFRGTKLPLQTEIVVIVVTRLCWNARYNMLRALGLATRYLRVSYSTQNPKIYQHYSYYFSTRYRYNLVNQITNMHFFDLFLGQMLFKF